MSRKLIATAIVATAPLAVLFAGASWTLADEPKQSFKFSFGARDVAPGYTRILPTTMYSK